MGKIYLFNKKCWIPTWAGPHIQKVTQSGSDLKVLKKKKVLLKVYRFS